MANKLLVLGAAVVGVAAGMAGAQDGARKQPNVVYIMADDLGWTDVGVQGSKYYETPNIDRLAKEGVRFTSGYTAAPNCAPTRAALMTGQYGPRTGVFTVGSIDRFQWWTQKLEPPKNVQLLPLDRVLIPGVMKEAGYATALFGKWHLGQQPGYHPSLRGFDEAIVSNGKHFDFVTDPKVEYPKGEYLADFLTDKGVEFIKKNKDKPFFLYLPHFGVHAPKQAKPELIEKFKQKQAVGGHHDPVYAAMIYSVDESVGRIMKTIDELGLAKDTLIVFTSDNGGVGGYRREGLTRGGDTTDNAPLRGGKGQLYEGGVRVPFVFRWPGHIEAGRVSNEPIISVDILPTMAELSGGKLPKQPLDGVSILSHLTKGSAIERDALYWHFPGYLGAGGGGGGRGNRRGGGGAGANASENANANAAAADNDGDATAAAAALEWRTKPGGAVRKGDYKLIEWFEDGKVELYNLKNDLSQKHDLAKEKPEVAKELQAKLAAWRTEIGAKMPTPNDPAKNKGRKVVRETED